jgi:hypothetical protein
MKLKWKSALLIIAAVTVSTHVAAQEKKKTELSLPKLPIGLDAYRMWDQWPLQRLGSRAYMRSTYDRAGGNEGADASHFLFMKGEDYNVSLDVLGNGVLYFIRTNHWHGSPWHYVVDGKDNIVKETGTSDPVNAKKVFTKTEFSPSATFPQPLNWTWGTTKGADLVWTPIPFEKSVRLAYSRTRYGTGYYIYHLFANHEQLSQPVKTWNINNAPDQDVLNLVSKAGTDIAPLNIRKKAGRIKLDKENVVVADIKAPSSQIRALKFSLPLDKALDLERIRLKITWDGAAHASVDAPLSLFYGTGTFYNRENKEYLVKGFPINVRFDYPNNKVELGCYYPMPFLRSAKIELTGINPGNSAINYEVRYEPNTTPAPYSSYFHATYKDIPDPVLGKDLLLLDTRGIEGNHDWTGSFVGTSFIFSHNGSLGTLEGDPRFFFDDSKTPQAYGTGTEEWGGGGDYWGGQNMTLPFAGHPVGCRRKEDAKNEKDLIQSAYRFLLADLMPFGNRAQIQLEHGGENMSSEHYETVTYWYGLPASSLVKTDQIDIGSQSSEQAHSYSSPEASNVQSIISRYEWGIDQFPVRVWGMDTSSIKGYSDIKGKDVYPSHKEDGRFTKGTSEFTVKVDPNNKGALLRRTLDYSFPNQKAEVYIADGNGSNPVWQLAGTWYLAGSNTCVYSNPRGELDERLYVVQTSNRRFRDDEFLIPAKFTANRSALRIRIKALPDNTELFPEYRFPRESAWSELGYTVYSYVLPDVGNSGKSDGRSVRP